MIAALRPPLALLAIACIGTPSGAQSVRVTGVTTMRYIELRPFERDSVAADAAPGDGLLRQLADGRIVRCVPGEAFCRDLRPGAVVSTVPVLHDLDVSAWGFGQGIHLFTQLRARTAIGGNRDLWPRGDDAFDVLAAYAELERERLRLRAGRQWKVSGLGFYNFDGVSVATRPLAAVWVEAYGGRSLVRGLNAPRSGGALEAIEPLAPAEPGMLAGIQVRYRATPRIAMSALYQIDVQRDRGAVHSELAAADALLQLGGGSLEGRVEMDVAAAALNEARLHVRAPPIAHVAAFGEVRRYRPYFELWTIWGAFSPVGFDEARVGATWAALAGRVLVRGEGAYRRYGDIAGGESPDAFRTDGWSTAASASWAPAPPWRAEGGVRVEHGFGAARRDLQAGVVRQFPAGGSVALTGMLFERLYEFRLTEGRVAGVGAEGSWPFASRLRIHASGAAYRHVDRGDAPGMDWNQRRATVRLQWGFGAEPRASAGGPAR